ncbi:MAG TPA: MDR family MFS transporter [Xanthobacteraceae bacterium]|nr:MDR family MFS transporter [Xanthobacteraceae bacterium]
MAIFMSAVEATIVATAMPTIVSELGGFHLFSWVFAAYLLAQAVSTPVYGRLADLYGRKRMFFIGATIFLIGSAACGFTWIFNIWAVSRAYGLGMAALVVFRIFQGMGAGSLQSMATTIVGDIYPAAERARVQGWLSGVWGIAAIAGPALGALIVQHLHWSFVFWINLPIGVIAIAILLRYLDEQIQPRPHQINLMGAALLMLGIGAILMPAIQAQYLNAATSAALLVIGVTALVLLAIGERRASEPILPYKLWRSRIMAASNAGSLAIGMLLMCVVAFLPTYVEAVMGRTAVFAGTAVATQSVSWSCGSIISSRVLAFSSYRTTGVIGALLLIAGTGLLVSLDRDSAFWWLLPAALLVGLGMGFCNQTFLLTVQGGVGWNERGAATSSFLFLRTIGQALGAAFGGAILNFGVARHVPEAGDVMGGLFDPARRASLGADMVARLRDAIAGALHHVYIIAGILAVLTLIVTMLLPAKLGPAQSSRQ